MPKLRLTKTELKTQQDALKQYRRFLPTLQLKKQQLQMEIRDALDALGENERRLAIHREKTAGFVALFSDASVARYFPGMIEVERIQCGTANIAGVIVPVYESVEFAEHRYDLFASDYWIDAGRDALREEIRLGVEHRTLEERCRLLREELRTTSQRVNLFEKVKIPACRENIRAIRIYLTDQDTAGVARSKIAKRKTLEAAS